jgi:aldehyde:ferredoxin oxidoreductase
MKGYKGCILRVDLTSGSIVREELPQTLADRYIGGKGLGTALHCGENPPAVDSLSPGNRMFFVTGPGAGTSLPTACRSGLFCRSPLNGLGVDSYCGGSFGHFMKKAGYDVIVVEGRANSPAHLRIADGSVSIEDASDLWGKDIYETEAAVKERAGEGARVLSIGPAGERLVRYACIGHDRNRHFGRMGSGAVMGSKNLKAISVTGTGMVEVHDPEGLKQYVKELHRRIKEHPATGRVYPLAGTVNFVSKANALGVFPSHYWHRGEARAKERINFEFMQEHTLVKQTRCHGCLIGCAHINRIGDGPYAGIEIDGPEFETIYVFGGLCDVGDVREIIKLNDVCDRLGIDTMHAGNVIGLLMDATEKGRVPEHFRIGFGDTERILEFLDAVARREGPWFLIGEGVREAARRLGLSDLAIHVKGLEPAGYDPRGVQSMAITYGVGNRGATHLSSNSYARDISGTAREHELAGPDRSVKRATLERKAELVFNMINFNAVADCFIYCRFLNRDLLTWEDYTRALSLLTGAEKGEAELKRIANDIVTLGRRYNIACGLTADDDLLPERFYAEANVSEQSGGLTVSKEDYLRELQVYYEMRGWGADGVPTRAPETGI